MNPRRLHRETIFSISSVGFDSAIREAVFLKETPVSNRLSRHPALLIMALGNSLGSEGRVPRVLDLLRKWGLVELVLPKVVLNRCHNENCCTSSRGIPRVHFQPRPEL